MAAAPKDVSSNTRPYADLLKILDSISEPYGQMDGPPALDITEETRRQLIQAILSFPDPAVQVLEDDLLNKSYALIDLLGRHGDLMLIYALLSRGISVRRSQSLSYKPKARAAVKLARQCQRRKALFEIPIDIQDQLKSLRVDHGRAQGHTPQPHTQDQHARKRRDSTFADYKPSSSDPSSPGPSKRARAAILQARKDDEEAQRALKTKPDLIKPGSSPRPTLPDHPPPFIMKVARIPWKASALSIQTFFEVGADAYKLANKATHRLDALGRSVDKYRPRRSGPYNQIEAKFPNLSAPGSLVITEEQVDGKLYKTARIRYDTSEIAMKALDEFHDKRFLASELLSKTVTCTFER